MIKSLTAFDEYLTKRQANASSLNANHRETSRAMSSLKQTNEIRAKLMQENRREDLYKVIRKYSGFGITKDLVLEINDLVHVIKKTDPCGNLNNWFVDNGSKLNLYLYLSLYISINKKNI